LESTIIHIRSRSVAPYLVRRRAISSSILKASKKHSKNKQVHTHCAAWRSVAPYSVEAPGETKKQAKTNDQIVRSFERSDYILSKLHGPSFLKIFERTISPSSLIHEVHSTEMMAPFSSKSIANNTASRILHSCTSKLPTESNIRYLQPDRRRR